jgi:hypothetical protein
VAEYPPLRPAVKERCPLRGVLRTSLTDGSAAGVSSHEKNVFFSSADEHMKEAKAGNDSAVQPSTFFGECRPNLFVDSCQFVDQLNDIQGINSRRNRSR